MDMCRSLHATTSAATGRKSSVAMRRHCRLQMIRFQEHLQRIGRATSLVDHRPPRFPVTQMGSFQSLPQDADIFRRRTHENVHLLLKLSQIMRHRGTTGSMDDDPFPLFRSSLPSKVQRIEEVQRQNDLLGRRLLSIHRRRRETDDQPRTRPDSEHHVPQIACRSSEVFAKYAGWALELPKDRVVLMRLLRPRIVLYFGLMDGRLLGRVVVQLYTEAAPLLVLQFIRTCRRQRAHEFAMRRIFPNLWLEGYLLGQLEPSANAPPQLSDPMEYDTRVLSHAGHNCVLSCAKEYCVHGFPGGAINFSISFKPLSVANGQRVGFGRVVRGNKIVKCMQTYGTKNGKMSRTLVITHCDVL